MKIERIEMGPVTVIGREGSTDDGEGFIQKLWAQANEHFEEIAPLAKRRPDGTFAGFWGAMSDFSRSFRPWDGFNRGLYLAGAECEDGSEAPEGWTKWVVPACEYLRVELDAEDVFSRMIAYMEENGIPLAGAVNDYTDPATGISYNLFPVRRLGKEEGD